MRLNNLFAMAVRNLLARRVRTALNLLGLVIGASTLILTFAGTRGVADSLVAIVSETEELKAITVPSRQRHVEALEDVVKVVGEMSEARRAAFSERLRNEWLYNSPEPPTMVDLQDLQQIRGFEHVKAVYPNYALSAEIEFE